MKIINKNNVKIKSPKNVLCANIGESLSFKYNKGEISASEYYNELAKNKGFKNLSEYKKHIIKEKRKRGESPKNCKWSKEYLEYLYYKQNLSPYKIGKIHEPQVGDETISRWMDIFGIKKKKLVDDDGESLWQKYLKDEISGIEYKKLLNDKKRENGESPEKCIWSKEELEDLYYKQNLTMIQIGKIHDTPVSNVTISKWLNIFGIEKKSYDGENSGNWQGGISFKPYCDEFTHEVKEQVRNYWHRKCVLCNITEEKNGKRLSVHHVDYNKNQGCDSTEWKLLSLCMSCNFRVNYDRDYYENLFSNIIMIREIFEEYDNKIDWKSIGLISVYENEYISFYQYFHQLNVIFKKITIKNNMFNHKKFKIKLRNRNR